MTSESLNIIRDYRIAYRSRLASIIGRQEVFSGKAKFGIFGDGKEVAQVALSHNFRKGDFRSGYYRDQTLMFSLGLLTLEQFFAQLYGHADPEAEPFFGGRSMTGHFATRLLDSNGNWKDLVSEINSTADLSPTGAQMPRLTGLALASKLYRKLPELQTSGSKFSSKGNEIVFGTIGNAACAEGSFWETVNAVGVLQVPMLLSIWDDGYGISVPNKLQIVKSDISSILEGFRIGDGRDSGIQLYTVPGWNYPRLRETYEKAEDSVRTLHVPAVVHVTELTQPQGHSTSGSHERYKSDARLDWERKHDCLRKMRSWLVKKELAATEELNELESEEKRLVLEARDREWEAFRAPLDNECRVLLDLLRKTGKSVPSSSKAISGILDRLQLMKYPIRRDMMHAAGQALAAIYNHEEAFRQDLVKWIRDQEKSNAERYDSHLYSESLRSALKGIEVPASCSESSPEKPGYEILNACFDAAFSEIPELVAMGEDIGRMGGVNQGFANLQKKYGALRVMDTGIRETTIIGQAIGLAMRGLRPIAEIQYLDYILYCIQILSDDLASLHWRTRGGQKAPVIVRTRGHRLEGIWHSGSPMAGILNLVRGIYLCVPRNAVQAAGFYNTMFQSDDSAIIVEVLNAYREKAKMPDNIGKFTIPLGVPEILRPGSDLTLVTYGACCALALEAAEILNDLGIDVEVVDVRTLLPFDLPGIIRGSIQKTSRILFLDEDCPGGATAFMMQKVLEEQEGYQWLDCQPRTLSAKEHRPAYGSDGDYFSKPNEEQICRIVCEIMHESNPKRFPLFY